MTRIYWLVLQLVSWFLHYFSEQINREEMSTNIFFRISYVGFPKSMMWIFQSAIPKTQCSDWSYLSLKSRSA